MKIIKTVYHSNLLSPDSFSVEIANVKKYFPVSEKSSIGKWVLSMWKDPKYSMIPAYIYSNIDWDNDHILYCKYEQKIEDLSELTFPEEQ